jgi:steroid 5-alpha reductase family enzyme
MGSMLVQLLAVSLGINLVLFAIAFRLQTDKLTDISYALSFLGLDILSLHYARHPHLYSLILFLLVAIWSARIGSFLLIRVRYAGKDRRFDQMRTNLIAFSRFWIG